MILPGAVFSLAAISLGLALAEAPAYVQDYGYDRGAYGRHPLQVYRTTDLTVPQTNELRRSDACDTTHYTFMTPRGGETPYPQASIFDPDGHLVWTTQWEGQQLYNLQVQDYRGESYLTFWAGNDAVGGHGAGVYHMLDKHYQLNKTIAAANGLDADLHEFRLTPAGTALISVYEIVPWDLSALGKAVDGPTWDCLVQEIDVATGEALFQWRALDHYAVTDTFKPIGGDGEGDKAFDFFHINSIDKDAQGNYLISARYTRSLTYIDGTTGDVIWILGGRWNMFADLSGGRATDFAYQHDARFDADGTITLFDNAVNDFERTRAPTRGLRLQIDTQLMTVSVVAEYFNPRHIYAQSQGSLQTLPNGNVLLGYGNNAAFTEYGPDGTPLCDTHYAPEAWFGRGEVQSYRIFKFAWQGYPTDPPAQLLADDGTGTRRAYVSWNGATEVASWLLQGTEKSPNATLHAGDWTDLDTAARAGFETDMVLHSWYPPYLRFVARDTQNKILHTGAPMRFNSSEVWSEEPLHLKDDENFMVRILVYFCAALSLGMLFQITRSGWWSSRASF